MKNHFKSFAICVTRETSSHPLVAFTTLSESRLGHKFPPSCNKNRKILN